MNSLLRITFCVLILVHNPISLAIPYDDFEGSYILDFERWNNSLRYVRGIDNGVLLSELARAEVEGNNNTVFADGLSINSIKTTVNVKQAAATNAEARARIAGFFCDIDNTINGEFNEVFASFSISTFIDTPVVTIFLAHCLSNVCGDNSELIFLEQSVLGTPVYGRDHELSVSFNEGTHTFTFGFDDNTLDVGPSTVPRLASCGRSNADFKTIGTRIADNNDEPSVPNESGQIKATFDNVFVNGVIYDDFDNRATLDPTKWRTAEAGNEFRGIETFGTNNILRISTELCGEADSFESTSKGVVSPETVFAFGTDLMVHSSEIQAAQTEDDAETYVRIQGSFYNDGTAGGGVAGDVHMRLFITNQIREPGKRVGCFAWRCNDAHCENTDRIFFQEMGSWNVGGNHHAIIGIDRENRQLFCRYDNLSFFHDITTGIGNPVDNYKRLGTTVYGLDTGSCGFISAHFDNVVVNEFPDPIVPKPPVLRNISYNGFIPQKGISTGFIVQERTAFAITAESSLQPTLPNPSLVLRTLAGTELRSSVTCDSAQITNFIGRFLANEQDACISMVLDPGLYVAEVKDANNASGNALVSVTAALSAPASLENISYNGFVPADGVILGFIVEQNTTLAVTAEAISGDRPALGDPLIILKTINGIELQANNTCAPELAITHIGRQLSTVQDACIVTTLDAGAYIVEISDTDNSEGNSLISVTKSIANEN